MVQHHEGTGGDDAQASPQHDSGTHPRVEDVHVALVHPIDPPVAGIATPAPAPRILGPEQHRYGDYDDTTLVQFLQKHGFNSTLGEQTRFQLVGYGWQVMGSWVQTGLITQRVAQLCGGFRVHRIWNDQDGEELVADAVAIGLIKFEQQIMGFKWTPGGRASVKTYYIGSCVFGFKLAYVKLQRQQQREAECMRAAENQAARLTEPPRHPEDLAIERARLHTYMSAAPDRLRHILYLKSLEYTAAETGEILDCSRKTVESTLYRWRNGLEGESADDE
ncbi:RNA polymerase sigma factor (sigma-70 family) [Streptomyces sp. 846.5]|nr:sigma-70 family RNA polymerase sigma factor [Streptomyces sp. 846.5]TDT94166.1 RNA polymerase sigma factor (sigma-70 family) [Streptomyces sp. 846.5]